MRTTLDIEEKALSIVRSLAEQEQISLGKAASILIEKSMDTASSNKDSAFPLLPLANKTHVITSELVKEHLDDGL